MLDQDSVIYNALVWVNGAVYIHILLRPHAGFETQYMCGNIGCDIINAVPFCPFLTSNVTANQFDPVTNLIK